MMYMTENITFDFNVAIKRVKRAREREREKNDNTRPYYCANNINYGIIRLIYFK